MSRHWSSAICPQRPPIPHLGHWAAGLAVSVAALAGAIYVYARENIPERVESGESVESMIVSLGAPAQRLEPPPPPPPEAEPVPPEPSMPTERAEDAPPPAPPPKPRPVIQSAPSDGKPSSGFGTGSQPGPPEPSPPPPPPRLHQRFIDVSTAAYVSQVSYPYESLRRRQQGTGQLMVVINRQGTVLEWSLIRSTGYHNLDREIERVARQVERLDPLPDYYPQPTANLIIPFSFILDN